jgi:long-chain acyl-CoA synthetase
MTRQSLSEVLDAFWRNGPEPACVHRRGWRTERWSYRRIAEAASQFARELEARGIGKGDGVMLWGENCAEWVAAFFGCILRGAVVVPMDKISAPDFACRVAQQVEAKLLVRSRELHLGGNGGPHLPELILEDLAEVIAAHSKGRYDAVPTQPTDTAQIIFTSGTTTEPKGVVISHKNILANLDPLEVEIKKYQKYGRIFHPLRFLNLLPLSHVFGQFLGIFVPQTIGATVIFQDTLNPGEVIRTIKKERVSVLIAVPRMLESLKDKIERDFEAAGKQEWFRRTFAACEKEHFTRRWWRFRKIHNQFGFYLLWFV